ncbi:hypothetical protein [Acinetobacter kanungonis]|uniref:hypothetical protein n=1 Tax=Acinetobacter kanungonis TaxID=2699469 RepID=UPI00137A74CA|nr:hypothetical protein [Acinetobacter kanungonis]NCI78131.1 hypothetical protein [Acinetobacter kanungonis]
MNILKTAFLGTATVMGLAGCATSSTQPPNIASTGLLICAQNELCPAVKVTWNEQERSHLKITAYLPSAKEDYDIQQFVFLIDQKPYSYTPAAATTHEYINRMVPHRSSNYIVVPSSFLSTFKNAKDIELKLVTNKGNITRPVYRNGQQSSAYRAFINLYQP